MLLILYLNTFMLIPLVKYKLLIKHIVENMSDLKILHHSIHVL
jgi:hypothetical protein